ncbi:Cell surface superoxide dismutase [Cu-Zn] 4 [Neophaeococcomyces mojaviensis]|uniref:Cell surface superoxide dismutase [Cu-Zn] 4 n=1 Tax=Neophaeococcomyces mojaviensis TaxID=3383035 RepID=A0ACC2ZU42_9EURO|nr:Cell surface superoxide dismutase [Cu-Zn] 4 [Knufia sp. JES_112]
MAYHIHEKPVPVDGNCGGTGEHLDPYHAGTNYKCEPNNQSLCQIGDLSGKHGTIHIDGTGTGSYSFTYFDDYLSTTSENASFFGNLSVVVHRKRDSFRLNCGNFTRMASTPPTSDSPSSTGGNNAANTYMSMGVSVSTNGVTTATVPSGSASSYTGTVTAVLTDSGTVFTLAQPSQTIPASVFTGSSSLMSDKARGTILLGLILALAGMIMM